MNKNINDYELAGEEFRAMVLSIGGEKSVHLCSDNFEFEVKRFIEEDQEEWYPTHFCVNASDIKSVRMVSNRLFSFTINEIKYQECVNDNWVEKTLSESTILISN